MTAGLNKGELKNTLAKTVCFNRLGELRDRSAPKTDSSPVMQGKVSLRQDTLSPFMRSV